MKSRSIIGYALGALGVLIVVASATAAFWLVFRGTSGVPVLLYFTTLVGAGLGWWGFFWVDSKRSLEGGGFLVSAAERLRLARAGRRDTDPIVPVPVPVPMPIPAPVSVPVPVAASASDGVAAPAAPAQPVAPPSPDTP